MFKKVFLYTLFIFVAMALTPFVLLAIGYLYKRNGKAETWKAARNVSLFYLVIYGILIATSILPFFLS